MLDEKANYYYLKKKSKETNRDVGGEGDDKDRLQMDLIR